MKAAMRALKNHALSYSDIEVKVREATSNDPWSCPLSLMRELSRATHDYQSYPQLFAMLWKRLADVEHAMHVTKALQLLDFLVRHGSERFVLDVKRRQRDIAALQRYKHYDQNNQDDAKEARLKAKQIHELLANDAKLQAERQAADKQRQQSDRGGGAGGGGYQLTEDERHEEELYRARKQQHKAQRTKQQQHKNEDLDEELDEELDDEVRRRPQQQHTRTTRRQAEEDDDEGDEQRGLAEEKRHAPAPVRKAKTAAMNAAHGASTAARPKSAVSRAEKSRAESVGGGVTFVSEEELEDESSADVKDGQHGQQAQRSTRTVKRTVRRKTTSSSVQEDEGDELTQEREEQEEETQAQRSNVSANSATFRGTALRINNS